MSLLIKVLIKPELLAQLALTQWQQLLTEAHASDLLGRVAYLCKQQNIAVPPPVQWHLNAAEKIAEKQKKQAIREFVEVSNSLAKLAANLTFLKGAAYIAKNLNCCFGRTFSDIDILVAREQLIKVERLLKFNDWHQSEIDDYDDKYYRIWMHEIPPLYHGSRGTVLDVHHNILPLTNKHSPNVEQFNFQTVNVQNRQQVNVLADTDLVIHTAVHLFTESEFHHGLRDLSDIDMLLREYCENNQAFIEQLITRSNELGLSHYIWLALRYSQQILATPVPPELITQLNYQPNRQTSLLLDFCFINIFKPNHSSCQSWRTPIAKQLLYWRGHLLKMPINILIPHLLRKSLTRIKELFNKENEQPLIP